MRWDDTQFAPRTQSFASGLESPAFLTSREVQARWEGRIKIVAVAGILGSLVLLAFVPVLLGLTMGPIIHMSNYSLQSTGGCSWEQVLTLTNSGNRGGIANVTFFVDGSPWTSWLFRVDAFSRASESEPLSVPNCGSHRYGIALISVEPA